MASLADFLAIGDLTDAEIQTLNEHCYRGFVEKDGHYAFHGKEGKDYARTSFHLRGVKYSLRRHQLALYLKLKQSADEMSWGPGDEASHLCHVKWCYNPTHIVLESQELNKQRNTCLAERKCRGHGSAADCIL